MIACPGWCSTDSQVACTECSHGTITNSAYEYSSSPGGTARRIKHFDLGYVTPTSNESPAERQAREWREYQERIDHIASIRAGWGQPVLLLKPLYDVPPFVPIINRKVFTELKGIRNFKKRTKNNRQRAKNEKYTGRNSQRP